MSSNNFEITDLPIWGTDLSLGAKLLWFCHFRRAEAAANSALVREVLAILEQPHLGITSGVFAQELCDAGWMLSTSGALRAVLPITA
jgi:hypothetical protein